jgi:hypothetical protein
MQSYARHPDRLGTHRGHLRGNEPDTDMTEATPAIPVVMTEAKYLDVQLNLDPTEGKSEPAKSLKMMAKKLRSWLDQI